MARAKGQDRGGSGDDASQGALWSTGATGATGATNGTGEDTGHSHPGVTDDGATIDARPHALLQASSDEALKAKVLLVHERLCATYECPIPYFHELDPLSELVSSLLSHRTKNSDSGRAFKQLRRALPTWEQVRDADVQAVEELIAPATWPEQKAPRIQQVLRAIGEERGGDLSLEWLGELPVREARDWLERLPGVGPKTSAATLLFSRLRMAALPVDSHHHRVAQRLALIPSSLDVGPSHAVLEAQLPPGLTAQEVYDNHEALMLHGQRCCYYRDPACHRCAVYALCPTGQRLHPEIAAGTDVPLSRPA
jgi:endonuclease-3